MLPSIPRVLIRGWNEEEARIAGPEDQPHKLREVGEQYYKGSADFNKELLPTKDRPCTKRPAL